MGAKRPACTRCHQHERLQAMQSLVLKVWRSRACKFSRVIPEIDIWRAANLMLKRYGNKALEESAARANELAAQGGSPRRCGVAPHHRCRRPARNNTPPGPLH
jgi:hypothetical protein